MDSLSFGQKLQQLSEKQLQSLLAGENLVMHEDCDILVEPPLDTDDEAESKQAIIFAGSEAADLADTAALREQLLQEADSLLAGYYLVHPLSQAGFNRQVKQLATEHGVAAFSALEGQTPDCTLFVEDGTVIAETRGNPRHPYGAYLELQRPLNADALKKRFAVWLNAGEAYQRYLSMNTCRYSC